ncbi:MAG: tRNA (adenosine(37)-N6)-threonylcarbamoyltransferase complex dimerization subunit type 1 TsaB [Alysiella sp.]|uniref:tRNA (adenosine(37)-N6)-threonylcarbamoyltransferase complex dimerization subunit type 1 TsaB n=1 Tax=Alysiella sp. TaxID=1872483 RepID=UPI0026DA6EBC|nr:tRNA (adenosine(37)-N6)-threonylcarbamoyltransferase complex dimerization subunit type 1 TsaB [Alysiella sp.]MDO4433830.1 tRNA (adenosine(37)-N6)-threonylcarbamoyltransferase complex dimerization subunit type 1 TsaB [Alysiella sp.]
MQPDFSRPILAMDTATTFLSLALQSEGKVWQIHVEAVNRQAELILPNIQDLLVQAGITVADLGVLVYNQGAGAFTGLRIGLGIAQGLATPFNTPLIGVPALDAVAAQISGSNQLPKLILAASDARMGEVFYAWYLANETGHKRLSTYSVGKASEILLPENTLFSEIVGVGNAFALDNLPDFFRQPNAVKMCADMPTALDFLRLAQSGHYAAVPAARAELLYVRDKIALTAAEQAARRISGSLK